MKFQHLEGAKPSIKWASLSGLEDAHLGLFSKQAQDASTHRVCVGYGNMPSKIIGKEIFEVSKALRSKSQ